MRVHSKRRLFAVSTVFLLCLAAVRYNAVAAPVDLIICGSGGSDEYEQKFAGWGDRLQRVLVDKMDRPENNVWLLTESTEQPDRTSTLDSIRSTISKIAGAISPDQDFYIYLIGHGSYIRRVSKFNIPGPDLTATELADLIDTVSARRIITVNATSSGAAFINALSGPDRIICTATKSTEEKNAPEFMEHFIQGLEDMSADQDRDERISVLEACRNASALTAVWYLGEGLIATEHALLDDNNDGLGSRLPIKDTPPSKQDGALATAIYMKDFSFPPTVPRDLVDQYLNTLQKVDDLKGEKNTMPVGPYTTQLESLLIQAAKHNRNIHRLADGTSTQ
jgi:hypothetical protein